MPATIVRISKRSHEVLRKIATRSGETMQAILDKAIESYRRECFLREANQAFAALERDRALWQEELNERGEWDATLSDGLEGD
jgi:hypothetical protein